MQTNRVAIDPYLFAALAVFLRSGYAGVSMDMVAREANASRATLYNHFKNKDALFASAVGHVLEGVLAALETADRASRKASVVERVTALLVSWNGAFAEALAQSPHAQELKAAAEQKCAHAMAAAKERFHTTLATALRDYQQTGVLILPRGLSADALARALEQAAHGVKMSLPPPSASELAANIRLVVTLMLGGLMVRRATVSKRNSAIK